MPTVSEAGHMLADAYHASNNRNGQPTLDPGYAAPEGWHLDRFIDHTSTDGDVAAVFVSNDGSQVYIAGRGTATLHDALPDAGIVAGLDPASRIADAKDILATIRSEFPNADVTAGGHSLDGEVWAKVSEDQTGAPLDVLVLNAPNSFSGSSQDGHVLHINAEWDGVGHWGADYENFITLDTNVPWGPLNQFGDHGTHTAEQLVSQGI